MTLDGFNPLILPEVLGCPLPQVRNAVLSAARDLCKRAFVWNAFQAPISLVEGQASYALMPPAGAYVHTLKNVWMGSRELIAASMAHVAVVYPNWQFATSNEPTMYNMAEDQDKVRIFPAPVGVTGSTPQLRMRAVFIPTNTATTLPDFLGRNFDELIANGAKSRLLSPAGTDWSNPQLGLYYKTLFDEGVIAARIDEEHDRVQSSIIVTPRTFGE